MKEIYNHAIKLLRGRDYTVSELCEKLEAKFGTVPPQVIEQLLQKKLLDDRRFAENYVAKRRNRGAQRVREELATRGLAAELVDEIVSRTDWPSLKEALAAKMNVWALRGPLQPRDAARLFRALVRLGYDEETIREEIEQLRER
jgi:SOS response regulatory protein OraA/RecX